MLSAVPALNLAKFGYGCATKNSTCKVINLAKFSSTTKFSRTTPTTCKFRYGTVGDRVHQVLEYLNLLKYLGTTVRLGKTN